MPDVIMKSRGVGLTRSLFAEGQRRGGVAAKSVVVDDHLMTPARELVSARTPLVLDEPIRSDARTVECLFWRWRWIVSKLPQRVSVGGVTYWLSAWDFERGGYIMMGRLFGAA